MSSWLDAIHQHYGYNGKELDTDFGFNLLFYGTRLHDGALGRFSTIDRIADNFAFVSPYNYAENRVPNAIDLHGLQSVMSVSNSFFHGTGSKFQKENPKTAAAIAAVPIAIAAAPIAEAGYIFAAMNPEATAAISSFIYGAVTEQDLPGGFDDIGRVGKRVVGKSVDNLRISSGFRGNMCGPCAIVEDARLGGDFDLSEADVLQSIGKIADDFTGLKKSEIESFLGSSFEFVGGRKSLDKMLKSQGPGTRGIVYGSNSDYTILHAFNVQVEANGVVKYTDRTNDIGHTLQTFMNNLSFLQTN